MDKARVEFVNCLEWQRPVVGQDRQLIGKVSRMLNQIEMRGDKAVVQYSQQFDGFSPRWIRLKKFSEYKLEPTLATAIEEAATRIEAFCQLQKKQLKGQFINDEAGRFGFDYQAIDRIAAYIPAGRFPLISSALMTLLPAKVAGCEQRIACSPSEHPAILAAASLAGATAFLKIGGVQAIAAMANGYQGQAAVQLLVGPGNQYVNLAKQLLQHKISVDVSAGPSELLILADKKANMKWLIADMAAQAEHDSQAISILLARNKELLKQYADQISKDDELAALLGSGQIVLLAAKDKEQMIDFANLFAAEHLLLADSTIKAEQLRHYGSLFIGQNSAVAYGDYCSGPNHTLPTMGAANRSNGLNVMSFMKVQSIQQVSSKGRSLLSNIGIELATEEQLLWHKKSMQLRQ